MTARPMMFRVASPLPAAGASERIRERLRSPIALLWWNVGIKPRDAVVGLLVGRRIRARPVAAEAPIGRFVDSLVVRGRVIASPGGGCEVRITVRRARLSRVYLPLILAALALLFVLIAAVEGVPAVLIGVGFCAAAFVLNRAVLVAHQGAEPSEERLVRAWSDAIARDIDGSPPIPPDARGSEL